MKHNIITPKLLILKYIFTKRNIAQIIRKNNTWNLENKRINRSTDLIN